MVIRWLRRVFGGADRSSPQEPATVSDTSYEIAEGEPPLTTEMKAIAELAAKIARDLNASLKACANAPDISVKQAHLESIRNDLTGILALAREHPYIRIGRLDDVKRDIARLSDECEQQQQSAGASISDPVLESLASSFHVINESIDIAAKTKSPDTFASRIDVAEKTLYRARETATKFCRSIDGAAEARAAIDALKRRGPPVAPTKRSKQPAKQSSALIPDALKLEDMRPPELDLSPWVRIAAEDAGVRSAEFWASLRQDLRDGEFWADQIKDVRNEPLKRLGIGLENLPLPAAFRECAIATRALVRAAKKSGDPLDRPLSLLYWLAAMESFTVPYSMRLGAPGHNAMEMASGAEVAALPFTYDSLGYEHLDLLTVTDAKALVCIWGEPQGHSTLNSLHQDFWMECEDRAAEHLGREIQVR